MSTLADYGTLHRALIITARAFGLVTSDVWLLALIADHGGASDTELLEREMRGHGSLVRRSIRATRPRFCTGGDQRGRRLPITLTDEGWEVAERLESERKALQDGQRAAA